MSWDRVRGQDAARQSFQSAFARGRLGHSYLIVGPEGVGKHLFARELAKAFLCEKPPAPLTACDHCPGCTQVEARTHPDLHSVRTPPDKHELPVDAMREFCAQMSRKPSRGGRVVGIVEDADDFNAESANSFLKTLEEPPAGAVLLLIATGTDRQLPTILSRCQVVQLVPLNNADVVAVLEQHGITDAAKRDRLARLATGSIGRALALNDDAIWRVREELVEGITAHRPNFVRLAEIWQHFYEEAGKETVLQRLRVSLIIGFLVEALQQALRLSLGATVSAMNAVEEERLLSFARRLGPDRILELIDACIEADSWVERRVQLILVVESTLDQLTRPANV